MFTKLALNHSAHCFFNSYFRDHQTAYDQAEKCFKIKLPEATLTVPVIAYSKLGVHQFKNAFNLTVPKGSRTIGFLEAAELICRETDSKLYERLNSSIQTMALSLRLRQKEIQNLYSGNITFLDSEQNLHVGHNFHPTPKSRDEFSQDDLIKYGPEFGASFKLKWFLVKNDLIWQDQSHHFKKMDLYKKEVPQGYTAMPVHPWQKEVLLRDPVIKAYIRQNSIIEGGETPDQWFATSSMRSLYSPTCPYMIKFSMSVRMTNSIRHMQETEVKRGMLLHDVLMTTEGKNFSERFPNFHIMHEPMVMGIKDPEGNVLPQTIILLRENKLTPQDKASVLATLTQENPFQGKNLIGICLSENTSGTKWFEAFMQKVVAPLLVAQADYGIMLGAHQQNLIVHLKDGVPSGATFRDCQGTGYSNLGESKFLPELDDKEKFLANVVPQEASMKLFTYYLIVNSVMNTMAALGRASGDPEQLYIEQFQAFLTHLQNRVKDPFVIQHLLNSKDLHQKGNFRCSAKNLNENTTDNPLEIYNSFPNPFYRSAQ